MSPYRESGKTCAPSVGQELGKMNASQRDLMQQTARNLFSDAESLVATIERSGRNFTREEDLRLRSILDRASALQRTAAGEAETPIDQRSKLFRALRYMALANGNRITAEQLATRASDPEVGLIIKAAAAGADTSTAAWAGTIVAPALGEFIPLLRARAALFALAVPQPLAGSVNYPRMSAGSASGFVAEGAAIPAKQNTLESLALAPYKAAALVSLTSELWRRADAFSESAVMTPLADDIALGVDQVFLSNSASSTAAPAGIFHSSNAATAIAATGGGTAQACATDLANLIAAGAAHTAPRLLIHPTALAAALALSNSNTFAIIQALATGSIGRVQIVEAANLPAVDTLALIDADGLLVASDGLLLDVSEHATIHSDTAPNADILVPASGGISVFQTDSVSAAVKLGVTWRSKRVSQVQWVSGATWV